MTIDEIIEQLVAMERSAKTEAAKDGSVRKSWGLRGRISGLRDAIDLLAARDV